MPETMGDSGVKYNTLREMDKTIYDFRLATADKIMSLDEAYARYVVGGRPPKLLRMLRALWRVKDA